MTRVRGLLVVLLMTVLALNPVLAEARAGGSYRSGGSSYSSLGSRGSNTYGSLPGAAPIDRSVTPSSPSSPSVGSSWSQPSYGTPAYGYSAPRGGFWSGFGGGLFGAWIGSMIFGHGAYAAGYGGYGSQGGGLLATLIMLAICFFIGRALWRRIGQAGTMDFGPRPAFYSHGGFGGPIGGYQPAPTSAFSPGQGDLDAFTNVLTSVQNAWSRSDLSALSRVATPEMVSYFSEQLSTYASQRVANRVLDVRLIHGEPLQCWSEGSVQYVSARLRWQAIDYTESLDEPGRIVEGDQRRPAEVEEVWTFRRAAGGRWLLSAIQQRR